MEGARGFAGGAGPEGGPGGTEAERDVGAGEIGEVPEGVHAPAGENLGEGRSRLGGGEGQWGEKRAGVGDGEDGGGRGKGRRDVMSGVEREQRSGGEAGGGGEGEGGERGDVGRRRER